ncbi:hypothetical protein [Rhodopirellula europaea]|uniref:hypothetical protein n=1 Tax=Rhodopirellula europaea TaxID=1263866 RepID=UPI003D2966AF
MTVSLIRSLRRSTKGILCEFCQGHPDFFRAGVFHFDQDIANVRARVFGDFFGFGQLIETDDALLEQQIGEILHRPAHGESPSSTEKRCQPGPAQKGGPAT